MIQEPALGQKGGYSRMAFSSLMQAICDRKKIQHRETRSASASEAVVMLQGARSVLPGLAADDAVTAVIGHNPDVVQILDASDRSGRSSFLAYLPLNLAGMRALLTGQFDVGNPDLTQLCRPHEQPAAIYIWLVFAPGQLATTLLALDGYVGRLAPEACPFFTRPATERAGVLFGKMGFQAATIAYPNADDTLLGLAPASGFPAIFDPGPPSSSKLPSVRVARTLDDLLKSFSIRSATYIAEQACPFDEEFDGNDFCATHLIGEIDGEPAGSIRVRFFADFVKIERLAVRQEFRTSKLAFRLVREALHYARCKGYRRAYGHSRVDLTRFWGLFGFRPLADRQSFTFSDVEYVELEADLGISHDIVAIGADPYVLIRPEGEWDRPGPLDRSVSRSAARRSA